MKSVIVIGAGHIGAVIAEELSVTRNYQVTLTDLDKTISVHLRVGALPLFLFPTNALKYNLTWST
jgi:3-hydroxyacyl-CoA dehydrogenase